MHSQTLHHWLHNAITITMNHLQTNLQHIQQRIDAACQKSERNPAEITLLPVSKTNPTDIIRDAHKIGLRRFGENKVQEAQKKWEETQELDIDWCIIGHLQTNKAKHVARFATEVHSLDRLSLATALEKRLQKEGRQLDVLVQVNTSNEPQKYGLPPEDVMSFARELPHFDCLNVKGLMTLALFSAQEEHVRPCFKKLHLLRDQLRQDGPAHLNWGTLSMGMSNDFDIAIEEGATEVRVGQSLFGPRPTSDSKYWPK